jgi:hypothetical protein
VDTDPGQLSVALLDPGQGLGQNGLELDPAQNPQQARGDHQDRVVGRAEGGDVGPRVIDQHDGGLGDPGAHAQALDEVLEPRMVLWSGRLAAEHVPQPDDGGGPQHGGAPDPDGNAGDDPDGHADDPVDEQPDEQSDHDGRHHDPRDGARPHDPAGRSGVGGGPRRGACGVGGFGRRGRHQSNLTWTFWR